jgi:hypothetical protein
LPTTAETQATAGMKATAGPPTRAVAINSRNASKSNKAGNGMQGGQQQHRHHEHEVAAAAVEKPATFCRDTSNSSRNSQQGMTNLCCFEFEPLRF